MPVNVEIPVEKWAGSIRQITLGATAAEGGTRSHTITVGGETTLPFLGFDGKMPNRPRSPSRCAPSVPLKSGPSRSPKPGAIC